MSGIDGCVGEQGERRSQQGSGDKDENKAHMVFEVDNPDAQLGPEQIGEHAA